MTLTRKTLLIAIGTLLCLLAFLSFFSRTILLETFRQLEVSDTKDMVERGASAIIISVLKKPCALHTAWDMKWVAQNAHRY